MAGESYGDDTAFFVGSRGRLHGLPLGDRQVHRVFGELRRQLGWPNRGSHHAARIHDLRHYSESKAMPSSVGKALAAGCVEGFLRAWDAAYSGTSQGLEEGHQLIVGPEPGDSTLARFDLVESRLLDVEIRVEIDLRRLDRLVTEPQRDHAALHTRLQQFHGRRVAQHVRRHTLVAQGRAALAGVIDVLGQTGTARRLRSGESHARWGRRSRHRRSAISRSQAARHRQSSWSAASSAPCGPCRGPGHARQCPGKRRGDTGAVISDRRSPVWTARSMSAWSRRPDQVRRSGRAQQGVDLRTREKPDLRAGAALAGNGQDALNLCRMGGHLEGRIAKERADGGQSQVAAAGTDAPAVLQILQERGDQRCIDLFERQALWCHAKPLLREAQQLPKAVAVRGNRMGTGLTLLHQPRVKKPCSSAGKLGAAHGRLLPAALHAGHRQLP